jgi:two-component system, OmpR family, copper resistance phosphate regulon response regulator CusR
MRILIVEDETAIADFLRRGLEGEGYDAAVAADGELGEQLATSGEFDLVLLDLMLPGRDGLDVLRAIRSRSAALPVILLTARGRVDDRVRGLDAGATDYVTKPFAFEELAARVRTHLRHAGAGADTSIVAGDIEIDLLGRSVRRDGREVTLSAKEFSLLAHLARHANSVCTREELLKAVETVRSVGYALRTDA